MKKFTAILLLGIFVFNLFGYKIWNYYQEKSASKNLATAIDNNDFNTQNLILIKKPINLPYYNNSNEFARIDGEVEIDGAPYKYVKSRIINDTLEMLCLPNTTLSQIKIATTDFLKQTLDLQKNTSQKSKSPNSLILKKSLLDYDTNDLWQIVLQGNIINIKKKVIKYNTNLGTIHKIKIEQPPDYNNFV